MELKQELRLEMANRRRQCSVCGASGKVRIPDNQGPEAECPCPVCNGTGWIPDSEGVLL